MRANVRAFVELAVEALELRGPVYEFGSYQVEGQHEMADLRPLFPGQTYVGCDLRPGPGVDRLEDLADLTLPDGAARTILCVETLEHVFEARRAVEEMIRVLAPGGVIVVAAPLDFQIHDFPSDYWRLTPSCLQRLLSPLGAVLVGWQGNERFPHTVFGIGCKAPASAKFTRGTGRFIETYQHWVAQSAANAAWGRRIKKFVSGWVGSKSERYRWRDYYEVRFALELPAGPHWKREFFSTPHSGSASTARSDLV